MDADARETMNRERRKRLRKRGGLIRDESGQAMTEYVILVAITTAVAAWLYYPDNGIYQGIRHTYDKTVLVVSWPGP